MKKILTFVLAFVLVFTLAAPALAITGDTDPEETTTELAPVALDIQLFTAPPVNTSFGGFQVSKIAANKAYIVNEVAFYGVAVSFVELDTDEEFAMADADFLGAVLEVSSDAVALPDGTIEPFLFEADGDVFAPAVAADWNMVNNEWTVPAEAWDSGVTAYYFGQGVVEAKGVLVAELAKAPVWPLEIYDGQDLLYTVTEGTDLFTVENADGDTVDFELDDEEVVQIEVNDQPILFYVPVSGGGSVVQAIGLLEAGDTGFAEAKAVYDAVMKFFGFNYDAEGLLRDIHFEAKASGLYLKDEVALQLYTADIVIPGGVTPPKTGDAASVMGFVMIVLAIVAAGVVVSRKVRA